MDWLPAMWNDRLSRYMKNDNCPRCKRIVSYTQIPVAKVKVQTIPYGVRHLQCSCGWSDLNLRFVAFNALSKDNDFIVTDWEPVVAPTDTAKFAEAAVAEQEKRVEEKEEKRKTTETVEIKVNTATKRYVLLNSDTGAALEADSPNGPWTPMLDIGSKPVTVTKATVNPDAKVEAVKAQVQDTADRDPSLQQFVSGAKRGTDSLPFHLLNPHGMCAGAMTCGEGSTKYGDYNNMKGFPLSNLYDHAVYHLLKFWWCEGNTEHDLAHAAWNINQMVMQFDCPELYKECDDRPKHTFPNDEFDRYMQELKAIINRIHTKKKENI